MRSLLIKNKKAQFESVLIAVVMIFIVAIVLLFLNRLNTEFYGSLEGYLEENPDYNNSEAHETVKDLKEIEESRIWDYVFLAIYAGLMIQMMVLSFASRTNTVFFWIFALLGIIILIVGTILSNVWQEIAVNPEFAETITRFTITDTLLGTYFPTVITIIIFFTMIIIFGKFPGQQENA